ncbi:MAG: response regulator [Leptolyngbyaceae cyanobacterium MO_188.B28]|nr:response regulator [Leptolyngbyaceae cyanobacterium MO_188.B28]
MKHILIAEDEPRIADFLVRNLSEHDFSTVIAKNAREAIYLTQNHSFDLLILDLGLPDQDGLDILDRLRKQGEQLPNRLYRK